MLQQDLQLPESSLARSLIPVILDRLEQLVIEKTEMVHWTMPTVIATTISLKLPVQRLARTVAAIVVTEWICFKKTEKREKLSNAVLERCSRKTKLVFCLQSKRRLRRFARSILLWLVMHSQ